MGEGRVHMTRCTTRVRPWSPQSLPRCVQPFKDFPHVSLGQVSLFQLHKGLLGIFTLELNVFGRDVVLLKEELGELTK